MKWAEITVRVAAGAADIVAEIFTELGANGAVIEDPAVINEYIDEGRWDYRDIERKPVTGVVTVKAYLNPEDGLDWKIQELERRLLVIRAERDYDIAGEQAQRVQMLYTMYLECLVTGHALQKRGRRAVS